MRPFDLRLLRAVPAARRPVLALGVVGVLQGAATIGAAFAIANLAVAVVDGSALALAGAVLVGLFAVRGALAWTAERVAARAGAEVAAAVRSRLVERWLAGGSDERPSPAAAVTLAVQGCASMEPYAARLLPALVTAAVVPPAAVFALVLVDWRSAVVVVLTLPLLPVFAILIGRTTEADTRRRWRSLTALSGHFLDVVRGLPVLVAYGRAERQVETVGRVGRSHRLATLRTLRLAFLSAAALELLATISVALVAVTVGLRLTNGSLGLDTALVAILLAPEAYWPIRRVGVEFHAAADGAEAVAMAVSLLATPASESPGGPRTVAELPAGSPVVVACGATYTYPGDRRPALHPVDLVAEPGLTVITGESGAGKSTLLELLAGVRAPTAGSVESLPSHLVTQRAFLPSGTLREAVTLGNSATGSQVWEALRHVGLDGTVAALPQALETTIGDDGFGLSAGQRAQLVLARALLSRAPLLLLDEPTAHLDPAACAVVHGLIREVADRRTVVVVTHRPELLELADHHLHLTPVPVNPPEEAWP